MSTSEAEAEAPQRREDDGPVSPQRLVDVLQRAGLLLQRRGDDLSILCKGLCAVLERPAVLLHGAQHQPPLAPHDLRGKLQRRPVAAHRRLDHVLVVLEVRREQLQVGPALFDHLHPVLLVVEERLPHCVVRQEDLAAVAVVRTDLRERRVVHLDLAGCGGGGGGGV